MCGGGGGEKLCHFDLSSINSDFSFLTQALFVTPVLPCESVCAVKYVRMQRGNRERKEKTKRNQKQISTSKRAS